MFPVPRRFDSKRLPSLLNILAIVDRHPSCAQTTAQHRTAQHRWLYTYRALSCNGANFDASTTFVFWLFHWRIHVIVGSTQKHSKAIFELVDLSSGASEMIAFSVVDCMKRVAETELAIPFLNVQLWKVEGSRRSTEKHATEANWARREWVPPDELLYL